MKKIRSLDEDQTPAERRDAMTWAQRLKRVFDIDIETCSECGLYHSTSATIVGELTHQQ